MRTTITTPRLRTLAPLLPYLAVLLGLYCWNTLVNRLPVKPVETLYTVALPACNFIDAAVSKQLFADKYLTG
jgi:hypothetical protein